MLGGAAGGASGAPPGAAPPSPSGDSGAPAGADEGLAPQQMFMSKFMGQQEDSPEMITQMMDKAMVIIGTLMQRTMHKFPEVFSDLINTQKNLTTSKSKMQKVSQVHAPIQNAVAELTRMMPNQKPPQY